IAEQAEGNEGFGLPALPSEEGDEERDAGADHHRDGEPTRDGAPVVTLPLDQTEDDGEQRGTGQQNTNPVESMLPAGANVRDHEEGAHQRDDADGNVEKKDPPPVRDGDNHAAEGRPGDRRDADHRTRDAKGGPSV